MPVSVDHCWTTPSVCINGDFDPLQRHSYSPISDWWHRVYIEIWGPAICHTCPTVSITFKDFTRFQIVSQNPSVKLEIQCAFVHSLINCICIYLSRYSLISIHSIEKNSTRTAVVYIPILSDGMHPCFITDDAGQMRHWWGPLWTTIYFPVTE